MLGVTFFGLILTPVFYYVIRWFVERGGPKAEAHPAAEDAAAAPHAAPGTAAGPQH
jgi:multidrug efflux pump